MAIVKLSGACGVAVAGAVEAAAAVAVAPAVSLPPVPDDPPELPQATDKSIVPATAELTKALFFHLPIRFDLPWFFYTHSV
ncbi:hypothetical protein D3C76_1367190 [compost metagenome]